jgi:ACS family hexuronate transporter-like MFS transporter
MRHRFRYLIFLMVLVITIINYIDRGAISYAAESITHEYGMGRVVWGQVLGFFGYGYMFGALVGGALSDVWGTRRLWAIAGFAWAFFEAASAFAGDLGLMLFGGSAIAGFAVVRILFGFTEGPVYSVMNKTMSAWAAPAERATSVSVGILSTPLGALITAPVSVGLLLLTGNWRITFLILAIISALVLAAFLRVFTSLPQDNPRVSARELEIIRGASTSGVAAPAAAPDPSVSYLSLIRRPTVILNTIGYFSLVYVTFMLVNWTPKYLQDQSDWLLRRSGSLVVARSLFAAASLLMTTLFLALASQAHTASAVIALMTLANASNSLPNVVYWTVIIDSVPASRVGAISGSMHFIASFAAVIAPTLTGYLAAAFGYSSMFLAAAAVTAVAMAAMALVKPGNPAPVQR